MSTDMAPDAPKRRSSFALIVSLCFNLIFLGVIVMGVVHAAMRPPQMMAGEGLFVPHALMHIVPGESDKIQRIVDAHRERIDALRDAAKDARRAARGAFAAATFNQQAFDQSLARVKDADAALEAELLKVMSESVAVLTPDERQSVAGKMREHNRPWWRHMGHGHDH